MADIVIKLLGALYGIYPVKLFVLKRIETYFFKYHVAQILREASKNFSIGKHRDVIDLAEMSPFRGLIGELIKVGDFYPTPADIAVAINISIGAYGRDDENMPGIIDLAFHLSHELKSRLISDQLLKTIFHDLNKDLAMMATTGDRMEIESLFKNKKSLFLSYYSTFEKPEFSYSIKVWHQNQGNSYIDWNEEDALVVRLNPARIREGFFQLGFDYFCNKTERRLVFATRSGGYEKFNGDYKDDVIWAR